MSPPSSTLQVSQREPLTSHGDDGLAYKILVGTNGGLLVEIVGASAGGDASAANQTIEITKLTSIDGKLPALVSGRVPVDGSGVTQPVSTASLPLPSGAATESTLVSASAKLPAALGPATPTGSISTVAAQSSAAPICWQVPATTTGRALLIAWVAGTTYTVGEAVLNDGGKMYVCRTPGTAAGSGGPTGTNADITDNTVHWSHVTSTPTAFKGSIILRNQQASASALYYGSSAALAPGGAELPQGGAEPVFVADPTLVFVATASSTARATVAGYL